MESIHLFQWDIWTMQQFYREYPGLAMKLYRHVEDRWAGR